MVEDVKTIFFVEDSEVELLAYKSAMERAGYCVHWSKDGLEALKLLNNIAPDLILLDLVLPRFDGVDVMKFLQAHPILKTVPVIIFSTNSIIDSEDEPLLEGAAKRLLKSKCTPAMMLRTIQEVLTTRSAVKGEPPKAATKPTREEAKPDAEFEMTAKQRAEAALAD
jgi:CheY-like chemotaxis protein